MLAGLFRGANAAAEGTSSHAVAPSESGRSVDIAGGMFAVCETTNLSDQCQRDWRLLEQRAAQ
jgi:hypothetical protein